MTGSQLTIGLGEDNPGDARLIEKMLREPPAAPYQIQWLSRLDEVLERVGREPFDVLLLDLGLPDSQGLATFERVNRQAPMMPIIIFSGGIDEQLAVEAVARGAQDYLVKGQINSVLLKRAIGYAIERKRAEIEFSRLNDEIQLQRMRVFKATMRTVQDIVGNALMSLYMFRTEVESLASPEALLTFDQTIEDTAARLKALGDLDKVVEIQMVMGPGIDIPSSGTRSADRNAPPVRVEKSEA